MPGPVPGQPERHGDPLRALGDLFKKMRDDDSAGKAPDRMRRYTVIVETRIESATSRTVSSTCRSFTVHTPYPGRMAPVSALAFLLGATALLLTANPRYAYGVQGAALGVAIAGLFLTRKVPIQAALAPSPGGATLAIGGTF